MDFICINLLTGVTWIQYSIFEYFNYPALNRMILISRRKKLIPKGDRSWSSLINYHLIISIIYGLPKTHKPDILLRSIISGIGYAPLRPHNIAKHLAKILFPLLGTINYAHIKNSGWLFNKLIDIDMKNESLS